MLILASQSPRRQEILSLAGIPFEARPAAIVERRAPGETPAQYVRRLAREKAEAIEPEAGQVVIGADTVVVVDDYILEKPAGPEDAWWMLWQLSGRQHQVITGVCLLKGRDAIVDHEVTAVRFISMSDEEIREYVDTGEPLDKAGGYAIQGRASKFVERIDGCYFNVVGLPISLVYRHLKKLWQQSANA